MTEQRGHGLPASHQLPYSYRYDDRSGVRYPVFESHGGFT